MDTTKTNPPLSRTEGTFEACAPVFHYPDLNPGERVSPLENLIALDLETGGLDEQGDQVLEIHARSGSIVRGRFVACNMQYGDLLVGGAYTLTFPLLLSTHIHELHPAVVDMHSKNGLLAESHKLFKDLAKGGESFEVGGRLARYFSKTDDCLAALFPKLPGGRTWTLLGNSVHFDLRFVRRVFPRFAQGLSHRCFDISAILMFCEALGLPYEKGEPAHRATADVDGSIKSLHKCVDFCQAVHDVPAVGVIAGFDDRGFVVKCPPGGPYSGT